MKLPNTNEERLSPVQGYDPTQPETKGWLEVLDVPAGSSAEEAKLQ
jgi:hypothetical protein